MGVKNINETSFYYTYKDRDVFLIKEENKKGIIVRHSLMVPFQYVGKRVRIKIEIIDDLGQDLITEYNVRDVVDEVIKQKLAEQRKKRSVCKKKDNTRRRPGVVVLE